MKALQSLISRISPFWEFGVKNRLTLFVQTKIVHPADAEGRRDDFKRGLTRVLFDNQLGFQGVAFLFA